MKACYAVIDIGTNSTRLMLADEHGQSFEKRMIASRIGDKLIDTGRLSDEGMIRTLHAIENFHAIARNAGAKEIYAFATSAVRDSKNREEFLNRCHNKLKLDIDVISGEDEAQMAFLGAVPEGAAARLIDIGGGSTELISGNNDVISVVGSVPVGAVKAASRYTDGSEGHIQARRDFREINSAIWERQKNGEAKLTVGTPKLLLNRLKNYGGPLYGVGGTITSLCALSLGMRDHYDGKRVSGQILTHASARKILWNLGAMGRENRERIPVLKGRADIICFGGAILLECMDGLGVSSLIVSDTDNLEGYLRSKLNSINSAIVKNAMRA